MNRKSLHSSFSTFRPHLTPLIIKSSFHNLQLRLAYAALLSLYYHPTSPTKLTLSPLALTLQNQVFYEPEFRKDQFLVLFFSVSTLLRSLLFLTTLLSYRTSTQTTRSFTFPFLALTRHIHLLNYHLLSTPPMTGLLQTVFLSTLQKQSTCSLALLNKDLRLFLPQSLFTVTFLPHLQKSETLVLRLILISPLLLTSLTYAEPPFTKFANSDKYALLLTLTLQLSLQMHLFLLNLITVTLFSTHFPTLP